jgi:hypothetical protein
VVPSASAQGIGFNPPGFGFGNPIGNGGLGGLGVTGIGGLGGLGCGFVAQNGIGANNVGQISAQAVPPDVGNNGAGCFNGGLGGLSGVNSGIGFGGLGGLVNPPGFGPGNPIGVGGLGGLGVTGLGGAFGLPGGLVNPPGFGPGNPIGVGGFGGVGGIGGVGGLGQNCVPAGPVIICQ